MQVEGGTDNHVGWPSRTFFQAVDYGGRFNPCSYILTGVWTQSRSREDIFSDLYNRFTWATWDTRAIVDFRINCTQAGGELKLKAGECIYADIRLSAEDILLTIEIITNGDVIWRARSDSLDVKYHINLGILNKPAYFYLRAMQRDGGIIYASPVFISFDENQ